MNRATKYLLIDISNSFTKVAFSSTTRVGRATRIRTEKFTSRLLRRFLVRHKFEMLVVCSVVPRKSREVKKAASKVKTLWLNPDLNLGVGIDYPAPKTIGADRLANAAAATALY